MKNKSDQICAKCGGTVKAYEGYGQYVNGVYKFFHMDFDADCKPAAKPVVASKPVEEPATEKQISYLVALGVSIEGCKISKATASQLIDAVKSGEGVGYLGFTMTDGSN